MSDAIDIKRELEHLLTPPDVLKPPAPPQTKKRTLGDIYTALEAQRVYSPGAPSIPKPMPATSLPLEQGTASKLGTEGRWGTEEK